MRSRQKRYLQGSRFSYRSAGRDLSETLFEKRLQFSENVVIGAFYIRIGPAKIVPRA